jgi:UDP-N-acetylmuramyl tripeptide synthase
VYNLLSAAAMAFDLGVPASCLQAGLDHYTGVFGRAERKSVHGKDVMIMLIKNPTGASEVLKLVGSDPNGRLLIAINDNYADGRDISWLWDAMFEAIQPSKPIIVSGHRAHDMAVRLKYAGIPDSGMTTVPDLKEAVQRSIEATQPGETLYILPTYTALLDLRFIL